MQLKEFKLKDLFMVMEKNDLSSFNNFVKTYGINSCEEKDKRNLLMYSIIQKKDVFSEELINWGIDLNYQDKQGYSALHFAVQENNLYIVDYLLKKEVDFDIVDINGNTPLWRALFNQKKIDNNIIISLLEAGADLNKHNNHGVAPLKFIKEDATYYSYLKNK
ncbi:MAG: ankyrin repeat domain-containing protein [Tannerella sp.]|jgi:ankyrin repeat protein|nr:ankyrin repeat domain-containing protein [Tannerella sp.]